MKQKPVAWTNNDELDCLKQEITCYMYGKKQFKDDIPLYTAPRELSDEEITEAIDEIVDAIGLNNDCMGDEWYEKGIKVFRAILRKAQE